MSIARAQETLIQEHKQLLRACEQLLQERRSDKPFLSPETLRDFSDTVLAAQTTSQNYHLCRTDDMRVTVQLDFAGLKILDEVLRREPR